MTLFGRGDARKRMRALEHAGSLRQGGDGAAAIAVLAPLLLAHPDDPAANIEMARALQLLDDASGAEDHYRRALAITLAYPIVVELAGVIGALGRGDEAEETLEAAMVMARQDKTLDAGEVHLMRAMLAAGRRDHPAAEAALKSLEESKPGERLLEHGRKLRTRLSSTA